MPNINFSLVVDDCARRDRIGNWLIAIGSAWLMGVPLVFHRRVQV